MESDYSQRDIIKYMNNVIFDYLNKEQGKQTILNSDRVRYIKDSLNHYYSHYIEQLSKL